MFKWLKSEKFRSPANAWFFFILFLISNSLLSYCPLSLEQKMGLGFFGIILPFLIYYALSVRPLSNQGPSYLLPSFGPVPAWLWIGVIGTACFFRLFHLTTLSSWPMPDEGLFPYYAITQGQKGHWELFFTNSHPPMIIWLLSIFFKVFTPSLFSIWLFPALISILTMALVYGAVRNSFGGSFAFVLLVIGAGSFAFLYSSRFCEPPVLELFWTLLVMFLLSRFARNPGWRSALILGLSTGLGFFVVIQWVLIAFSIGLAVFFLSSKKESLDQGRSMAFLLPTLIFMALFAFLWLRNGNSLHVQKIWAFQDQMDWIGQLKNSFYNVTSLFWNSPYPTCYGPLWGGMLNPVLTSCSFFGFAECLFHWRRPLVRWLGISLFLFLLPAFVSKGFEVFRMVQVFPLLALLSAIGLQRLLLDIPAKRKDLRLIGVALCLIASTLLDQHHLEGVYHRLWGTPNPFWQNIKSSELWMAYGILEQDSVKDGNGFLLSDIKPDPTDQTLSIAAYPFNAALNPAIPKDQVKWVAFIVNANYKPFLSERFPEGKWFWLEKYSSTTNQPQMLGVIPMNARTSPYLRRWIAANERSKLVTSAILDSFSGGTGQPQKPYLDLLLKIYPAFQGDPFLESCFWEKVVFHCKADRNKLEVLEALEEGLKKGYPLPQFWNDEGVLFEELGKKEKARKAFLRAVHFPIYQPVAEANLEALDHQQPPSTRAKDKVE